jgi:hypothetical protein
VPAAAGLAAFRQQRHAAAEREEAGGNLDRIAGSLVI